jgi:hypothetical protein
VHARLGDTPSEMGGEAEMIDFPIGELLDDAACLAWLECYRYPDGWVCPHCGSPERCRFRHQTFPAYRSRACDGYATLLTTTPFGHPPTSGDDRAYPARDCQR